MTLGMVTRWLLLLAVIVLACWTTIAAVWGVPGDTVSEVVLRYSQQYPILGVVFGVLCGHWFWPLKCQRCTPAHGLLLPKLKR